MRKCCYMICAMVLLLQLTYSQSLQLNRQQFFLADSIIEVTLATDIKKLKTQTKVPVWQAGSITMHFSKDAEITEDIRVQPRGVYRRENCDIAALLLDFNNASSPALAPLKKLKLVGSCRMGNGNEDLLLKEYLIYKLYNALSELSFRVRLLHISYNDSKKKYKPYSQYAFLIEDLKDLAERNNCIEIKKTVFLKDGTHRNHMTIVNLFQYMIGNTDWSIPNNHNIKLVVPKNDPLNKPFVIPYDFDYAGLVNAPYAVPKEDLMIATVTDKYYKGFVRTMDELLKAVDIFKTKKDSLLLMINNFQLLNNRVKNQMTRYLEEFFQIIDDNKLIRTFFINNARVK